MEKLLHGLHQFQSEIHQINQDFFEHLSKGQSPDAVFITCSDSRVVPNLITTSAPGDLFVIQNAGNIVPPYGEWSGEEASIEYAINALNVKDIVVCGHSQCGAMKGLLKPEAVEELPAVSHWLRHAQDTKKLIDDNYKGLEFDAALNIAIQENVLVQIEHLRSLPCISKKIMKREIELHAWTYEIETGIVYIYDVVSEDFLPLVKTDTGFELKST